MGNDRNFEQNKNKSYTVSDKWHKHQYQTMSRTLVEDFRGKFPVLVFIKDQSTLESESCSVMSDSL